MPRTCLKTWWRLRAARRRCRSSTSIWISSKNRMWRFQLNCGGSSLFRKFTKVERFPPIGMPENLRTGGRGQPGRALVMDLAAHDQGQDLVDVALAHPEGREVDHGDARMVVDFVEKEGEVGETDENGAPFADDRVILLVDPGRQVFGPRPAGHGKNQVLFPDDFFEVFGPDIGRGRDVIDLLVARVKKRAEVGFDRSAQGLFNKPDGPVERALLAPGETGGRSYE